MVEKPLPCVVFFEARHVRRINQFVGLDCEAKHTSQSAQLPIYTGVGSGSLCRLEMYFFMRSVRISMARSVPNTFFKWLIESVTDRSVRLPLVL